MWASSLAVVVISIVAVAGAEMVVTVHQYQGGCCDNLLVARSVR